MTLYKFQKACLVALYENIKKYKYISLKLENGSGKTFIVISYFKFPICNGVNYIICHNYKLSRWKEHLNIMKIKYNIYNSKIKLMTYEEIKYKSIKCNVLILDNPLYVDTTIESANTIVLTSNSNRINWKTKEEFLLIKFPSKLIFLEIKIKVNYRITYVTDNEYKIFKRRYIFKRSNVIDELAEHLINEITSGLILILSAILKKSKVIDLYSGFSEITESKLIKTDEESHPIYSLPYNIKNITDIIIYNNSNILHFSILRHLMENSNVTIWLVDPAKNKPCIYYESDSE